MRKPRFWTKAKLNIIRRNIHLSDEELGVLTGSTKWGVNQARLRYRILRPKKQFKEKTCPICKKRKPISEFCTYFSKIRLQVRVQNYCDDCTPSEKTRRSKEYYQRKGEKVRKYQKTYRTQKRELIRPKKRAFNQKYRTELHDLYVIDQIRQTTGLAAGVIRKQPDLIDAERMRIKLVRTIKSKRNEKQNGRSEKPSISSHRKAKR
jgi:hypothetical protein